MLFFLNIKFSKFRTISNDSFHFLFVGILSTTTILLPLSAFWIIKSLFFNNEFKACNSISLKLFLGLFFLNIPNKENAVSNDLDLMVSF